MCPYISEFHWEEKLSFLLSQNWIDLDVAHETWLTLQLLYLLLTRNFSLFVQQYGLRMPVIGSNFC